MEPSTAGLFGSSSPKRRNVRTMMRQASIVADCVALVAATVAALALRGTVSTSLGLGAMPPVGYWSLGVLFLAVLGAYSSVGLYEREAYVSRPLHASTIVEATVLAFIVSAAIAFLMGPALFSVTRLTLVLSFVLFLVFDMAVRLLPLHRMYVSWVKARRPIGFVVGDSPGSRRVTTRLLTLRGFTRVRSVDEESPSGSWAEAVAWELGHRSPDDLHADSVFIDSGSVPPREIMHIIEAAQARGVDVYVASGLLGPLEGSRLLKSLFQAPMTRVRRPVASRPGYASKRALDILGSSAALLLLSPVIAIVGVIIKLTSAGPVFLTQMRVGRSGATFGFLKFRSMYVDADSASHEQYVRALINGDAKPTASDAEGNGVFHIVNDPRVTPIGRFIRKYSLDEIPQLWNVFRGDMSLVGPRPPLPYEAAEYDEWQQRRLEVQSGITGVWQVAGRNRVSFDEMTLQDLIYGMNTGLWVDLRLCLMTIPAALIGSGL
jgi:exopolysaccharide biosynthesis polyprenyl glycosylphosphotransferase